MKPMNVINGGNKSEVGTKRGRKGTHRVKGRQDGIGVRVLRARLKYVKMLILLVLSKILIVMNSDSSHKPVKAELPGLIRLYDDGSVERLAGSSYVPPTEQDSA
ncbi:hypothetical protein AKJ16_DCAP12240 [Drosera capensis]